MAVSCESTLPDLAITRTTDIDACRRLRRIVFMHEQGVSEADEVDGQDGQAVHLLATLDGAPVGTARLLVYGSTGKIGRVCVLKAMRGKGIGAALIREAVAQFRAMPGVTTAKLGAQTHAMGFYERMGFAATGPQYDDAGIPHRDMVLALTSN